VRRGLTAASNYADGWGLEKAGGWAGERAQNSRGRIAGISIHLRSGWAADRAERDAGIHTEPKYTPSLSSSELSPNRIVPVLAMQNVMEKLGRLHFLPMSRAPVSRPVEISCTRGPAAGEARDIGSREHDISQPPRGCLGVGGWSVGIYMCSRQQWKGKKRGCLMEGGSVFFSFFLFLG
jgi:hypothetical protein